MKNLINNVFKNTKFRAETSLYVLIKLELQNLNNYILCAFE